MNASHTCMQARARDVRTAPRVSDDDQREELNWFVVAFALSMVLLGWAVYQLVVWPRDDAGSQQWRLHGAPALLMAAVAILSGIRWSTFFILSFVAQLSRRRAVASVLTRYPFVSIFVPCFNESKTIAAALDSMLELDYPAYEVVVVNDGSTDDTLARARQYEGTHGSCTVRVLDKPNGGKWSAHNLAFRNSAGELILCVDADSRLEPQSLDRLVVRMADPLVSGVAGQMRVRNRANVLTRLQALEYLMGNGAVRMAQGLASTVLVVPGPIGLFRRSAMEEVWSRYNTDPDNGHPGHVTGPFEGNTFAEDFDLSLAMLCLGGRIVYEPDAISHTKAPDRMFTLLNQRYRWIRGSIQVLRKAWRRLRSEQNSATWRLVAWLASTYIPDLFALPLIYLLGFTALGMLLLEGNDPQPLFLSAGAMLLLQFSAGAFFARIHQDTFRLLLILPLYGVYNGFVLNSAWAIALLDELRGSRMRW